MTQYKHMKSSEWTGFKVSVLLHVYTTVGVRSAVTGPDSSQVLFLC